MPSWSSYDTAAATHQRLSADLIFTPPARELIARLEIPSPAVVLDVGTGTGVAGRIAQQDSCSKSYIAGIDPSMEMLRAARTGGLTRLAQARAPGIPFRSRLFQRVMANFVIAHIVDCESALADMVRVLEPGGRLGLTAWTADADGPRRVWQQVADSFMPGQTLEQAIREALPWEDRFADPLQFEQALLAAGLRRVDVQRYEFTATMSLADFLAMREASFQARFFRHHLSQERWDQFRGQVSGEMRRRFPDPVEHTRSAWLATGIKP